MRVALMFAGQGSQRVGMAQTLVGELPETKSLWEIADKISGLGVFKAASEGPEELLANTIYTQPALFVWGYAVGREIVKRCRPTFLCGHSLGEYIAFAVAGAISFEDGLKIVCKRARLMSQAKEGAMTAVIGSSVEDVDRAMERAKSAGYVTASNINSPKQVVVSGETKAVEIFEREIKPRARRVVRLKVSGAFHSELMRDAKEKLARVLEEVPFGDPEIPVVSGVGGKVVKTGEDAKKALLDLMVKPVDWVAVLKTLDREGIEAFVEVSPRPVLSRFVMETLGGRKTVVISSPAGIEGIEKL